MDSFKRFTRKLFGFLGGVCSEGWDHLKLMWFQNRIKSLKEDIALDLKFELGLDRNKVVEILFLLDACKEIERRINNREISRRVVQHA